MDLAKWDFEMKKILVASAAFVLVPLCSSAATFQINVTGDLEYALYGNVYSEDSLTVGGFTQLGLVQIDDPTSPFYNPSVIDYSGAGSVLVETTDSIYDTAYASNCTGLLQYLCLAGNFEFDQTTAKLISYSTGGGSELQVGPFTVGSVGTFSFANEYGSGSPFVNFDGSFYGLTSWVGGEAYHLGDYDGEVIALAPAVALSYNLTSYSISAIPLPAALPLLLAGLGGLGFIGRRKKKAA